MRHTYSALACLALSILGFSAPVAAQSNWSGNINLVSQYRFRGIDQTWGQPALQGGVDYKNPNGWYAGAWSSNISSRSYAGGHSELDLYGGYNGKINDDWSYTAGLYGYIYPGANVSKTACPSAALSAPCAALPGQSYNTLEANAGVSWKQLSYKLSVAGSDYFGANTHTGYNGRSRGTLYHDISASFDLPQGMNLVLHAGYTDVAAQIGGNSANYWDWRASLGKNFDNGWNGSLSLVGAGNNTLYRPPLGGLSLKDGQTRSLNRNVVVVQVGKTF
jgi:uncharacterized protein (TIGR02001 family)